MPHATTADSETTPDTGLQCLIVLARFQQVAADGKQIQYQFGHQGKPLNDEDLVRAARYLKLKAKLSTNSWEGLANTPLPAIGKHQDGHYFIIAKIADDKVLIQDPLEKLVCSAIHWITAVISAFCILIVSNSSGSNVLPVDA
ncbi:MAG: cysteine peptidase family C39 domain-containing protein [Pseudomonadales bacterium]